jgi:hypothetical protein
MSSLQPFPSWAVAVVRIVATPIALGFRYTVVPQGRGRITAYRLDHARATARRYSRRVLEIGARGAFPASAGGPRREVPAQGRRDHGPIPRRPHHRGSRARGQVHQPPGAARSEGSQGRGQERLSGIVAATVKPPRPTRTNEDIRAARAAKRIRRGRNPWGAFIAFRMAELYRYFNKRYGAAPLPSFPN